MTEITSFPLETLRIDELPVTGNPGRDHEVPAMREAISVRLTVAQILSVLTRSDLNGLLIAEDVAFDPGTAGPLTAADVQAALQELAEDYLRSDAVTGFGLSVLEAANAAAAGLQPIDADLSAIAALSGIGIAVRIDANTWEQRTITGTASEIAVANGTGAAGNPTISLPSALTFTGKTVTGGTFNNPTIAGHTFTDPVNARTGTSGVAAYWQHWGWTGEQPRWSWWVAANSYLQLHALNGAGSQTATSIIFNNSGNVQIPNDFSIVGTLSKGSGTFKIDHPLDPTNKNLVHGFVEAPEHQVRYRGSVTLVGGSAAVNLDQIAGMTAGTFVELTKNAEVMTLRNKTGTAHVSCTDIEAGEFTITSADLTATVLFEVVATRDDYFVRSGLDKSTDESGDLIVEPEKEEV